LLREERAANPYCRRMVRYPFGSEFMPDRLNAFKRGFADLLQHWNESIHLPKTDEGMLLWRRRW
jgi:hypothetical protein